MGRGRGAWGGAILLGMSAVLALLAGPRASVAAPKEDPASLRWRRTYREALLEARLRNVPVLVTRQKDG